MKIQATDWRKIFTKTITKKGLSRIWGQVSCKKSWAKKIFPFTLLVLLSNRNSLKFYSQNGDKLNVLYSFCGVNEELSFIN